MPGRAGSTDQRSRYGEVNHPEEGQNQDNPEPSEDAGQRGAGSATDAIGGLEEGTEPEGDDVRESERP